MAIVLLRKYGPWLLGAMVVSVGVGLYLLQDLVREWMGAGKGAFGGNYSIVAILASLFIIGGLSWWSLAVIPLLRFPTSWSSQDIFLVVMLGAGAGPLLLLTPFGGGVASRYFLYCLPCMFLLAAQHWRQIDERLPTVGYRLALGCALFAFNVPHLLSAAVDGNHFDHRAIAHAIEELNFENPIIFSSGHRLVDYYLDDRFVVQSDDADDLA